MKKNVLLAVACVAMVVPATAFAGDLDVYYDIRGTYAEIAAPVAPWTNSASVSPSGPAYPLCNGGGAGDGQIRWVSPTLINNWHVTGAEDASDENAYLYADCNFGVGEVLAALGVDMAITAGGVRTIADTNFSMVTGHWDGTALSTAFDATGGGIKGVQVPVAAGPPPTFDPLQGISMGPGWDIGTLQVLGGAYAAELNPPAYDLHMSVNELLITRVAAAGAGVVGVSFGYDNGSPCGPETAVVGNVQGGTSVLPDLSIVLKTKGDFDGDGTVTFQDLTVMFDCVTALTFATSNPNDAWSGDFDGDNSYTFQDLNRFFDLLGAGL